MNRKNNTKRFTQKKVASYDYKMIGIIAAIIVALVIAIVAVIAVVSHNNRYTSYVDGKGIRDYEYEIFLNTAISEMEEEAQKDDAEFDAAKFWTAEKQQEAKTKALEDSRVWMAKYKLALENGCKLTKAEEEEVENEINNYIYYYMQMYAQYGIDQAQVMSMLGIKNIEQTYDFQKKQKVISKYTEKLTDAMKVEDVYFKGEDDKKVTGEEAVLAQYNAHVSDYRKVELTTFAVSKPQPETMMPEEVKDPGAAPEGVEETSQEYLEWKSSKDAYDQYVTDLEAYQKAATEALTKRTETREKVQKIFDALVSDGKYTGEGVTLFAESQDNETQKAKEYIDATLEDLAAGEGAMYTNTKGVNKFSGDISEATEFLAKYALSLDWTDDTRTAIEYKEPENPEEEEENEEEPELEYDNDFTTSAIGELKLFEDEYYFYITKCTNIYDINTSTSEEKSADGENSVRYNVIYDLKNIKAEDDMDIKIASMAEKFANKKVKNNVIDKVAKEIFDAKKTA